jgi:hypothetical protein
MNLYVSRLQKYKFLFLFLSNEESARADVNAFVDFRFYFRRTAASSDKPKRGAGKTNRHNQLGNPLIELRNDCVNSHTRLSDDAVAFLSFTTRHERSER